MKVLKDIFKSITATIKLQKNNEKKNPVKKDVIQSDTVPKLLTACLKQVFKKFDWNNIRINIYGKRLKNLRFSGHSVLLSDAGES